MPQTEPIAGKPSAVSVPDESILDRDARSAEDISCGRKLGSESPAVLPRAIRTATDRSADADAVRSIVRAARRRPGSFRSGLVCALIAAVLLWGSFFPLAWAPLAWVALVPLGLLIRIRVPTRRMYLALYAGGLVFWLASLQWMRLGDVRMYPAWVLLSLYLAAYLPLTVLAARGLHHRVRVPLVLALPLAWVGGEFVRAHLLTGFAWYLLGHSQHHWTTLIQVSDLVGAYGVSFVVAAVGAAAARCVPAGYLKRLGLAGRSEEDAAGGDAPAANAWPSWSRGAVASASFALLLVGLASAYGMVRRAGVVFQRGPRVALVQGDFRSSLKHDPDEWSRIYRTHEALTGLAVRYQPDLIVWPETMFRWPLREVAGGVDDTQLLALGGPGVTEYREDWIRAWRDTTVPATLQELSQKASAEMLIGIERHVAGRDRIRRYNSAVFVAPGKGIVGAYDKIHRVVFGEYVPLADTLPFLAALSPFPPDWGLEAGEAPRAFASKSDTLWVPVICFEDTVPHLVRRYLATLSQSGAEVNRCCLVNLTNDGWFTGSSEQEQHLVTAAFRCVENRVPMIRAVNTGISAIIDGDGVIREPEWVLDGQVWLQSGRDDVAIGLKDPRTGRWRKEANLVVIGSVPLDGRRSLYTRWGDWFAELCLFAAVCGVLCSIPAVGRVFSGA